MLRELGLDDDVHGFRTTSSQVLGADKRPQHSLDIPAVELAQARHRQDER